MDILSFLQGSDQAQADPSDAQVPAVPEQAEQPSQIKSGALSLVSTLDLAAFFDVSSAEIIGFMQSSGYEVADGIYEQFIIDIHSHYGMERS